LTQTIEELQERNRFSSLILNGGISIFKVVHFFFTIMRRSYVVFALVRGLLIVFDGMSSWLLCEACRRYLKSRGEKRRC
jgi:hypothetical protein